MTDETVEQAFTVTAPARLVVSNIRGSVEILPGDDGAITVTAVKHPKTGDPDRTEIEIEQQDDGTVTAKARHRKDGLRLSGRCQPCKVDFSVRVPRACSVKARCVSSSLTLHDLQGDFDLTTVSGRLSMADLSGTLRAQSVSGRIAGARLAGPARIENVSGRTVLVDSHLPVVEAETVSGAVVLETPLDEAPPGEGAHRFRSVSGAVRLLVPPETGCVVTGTSMSGRLQTSLPITRSERSGRGSWRVELQDGGPEITFSSVSGNLCLLPADEGAAEPDPDAMSRNGGNTPGDRSEILDRIASGELSVEEGLAKLGD